MELKETPRPKWLHFALLLLLSFLVFPIGYAVDQSFRWTNHMEGLLNGLIQGGAFGVAWCLIYVLPWSLIIFGLYRWRRWQRFRTQWILAPSILILTLMIGSLLFDPPSPTNRFKKFAKTDLPSNARNLHFHFTGGGVADYGDTYYFSTTPSEVDRLIADLKLTEDPCYAQDRMSQTGVQPLPGCPNYSSWEGSKQFKGWDEQEHWFYYLITDATRTHVYVMIGCI